MTTRAVGKGQKQPRLTIIFRGKGMRITPEEKAAWDSRIHVTFQPKAWADTAWCVSWAVSEFRRIMDEFVPTGRRGCAILDNLHGQCHQDFKTAMAKGRADTHYGVPGGTHLWQVVDDGIGHMVKNEMSEIIDEKLDDPQFCNEWCSGAMSASRVRVLTTEIAGEAWERCQKRLDCHKIFCNKGWAMTVDDRNDELKIAGLPDYDWKSGADLAAEQEGSESSSEHEDDGEEMVVAGDDSEDEDEGDAAVSDDAAGSSDEESDTDPGEWCDTEQHTAIPEYTKPKTKLVIAHKFLTEIGWEVGTIMRKSGKYWLVNYPSETELYRHELRQSDYGSAWLAIRTEYFFE